MKAAAILAVGEPACRAAADVARDLMAMARSAALYERGRTETALQSLADSRPAVATLRGEVQDRVRRLEQVRARLDQVSARLEGDLREVRALQGQAAPAGEAPMEIEQAGRLLSSRVVQIEGARQSLILSRALLLDLLSTERLTADQLGMMGDVTAALAFRKSRMEMLAARAECAAAMTGEIDETAQALLVRGRAGMAPAAPARRGWLGLKRARG